MKKNLLLVGGVTFSILAVTVPVMAQPQPGESGAGLPPQATPGGPGSGQFRQFGGGQGDSGADSAQRQAHRQKMLERFDANHDGKLDDNERAQMHQFMQQHRMMREQQNGSTQSNPAGNAQKGLGAPGNGGGLGGGQAKGQNNQQMQEQHRQKMVQRFDANHDGRLDDGERTQLREFIQQRRMMREKQNGGSSSAPPAPSQQ